MFDIRNKINLAIITVHKGNFEELKRTINSIDSQVLKPKKHLIVCSGVKKINTLKYKRKYREFIINKDNSIYNAMNIGISKIDDCHILFLNSNDILYSKLSLFKISKFLKPNTALIAATKLHYANLIFTIKNKEFKKKRYMPHSSFVAPPISKEKKIYFDTRYKIAADGIWMTNIVNISKKVIKLDKPLSIHNLGGISTSPTLKTIFFQFQYKKIEGLKEMLKYIIKSLFNNEKYYRLLYKLKYNLIKKND